jgi:peroxiredoxin
MQRLAFFVIVLAVAASGQSTTVVPRKSPDFMIVEPSGKETTLSSFKGKVVVIEFLFLKSLHCIRAAQTLNRLHRDLGSQGFQAVGIVFGPDADVQRVNYLVEDFKLTFPVGYANLDKVDSYFARESNETLNIPQIVVIDRAGVIRAQSGKKGGSPTLENESSLRSLIDSLLKEESPKNAKGPGVARKKGN